MMKNKLVENVSLVFAANIFVTIVSIILAIAIPKILSVENYGYWQLHVLYNGYTALLHWGWIDGVYVRYAGTNYYTLDKEKQHSQFVSLMVIEVIVSLLGFFVCKIFISDYEKLFSIVTVFAVSVFTIPSSMLLFLMQGGDRIKEYSIATVSGRLIYLILSVMSLILYKNSFRSIIIASILGRITTFIYTVYQCRDIVFCTGYNLKETIKESFENIRCGIKVSIAYLTGNLIVGSIKYFIESQWGVTVFGEASLTISMTNILMVLINSVGIVLLPIIRNVDSESQKKAYDRINRVLTTFLIFAFAVYYPISVVLVRILPKYTESIAMMALIFPICLFESRMGLLNNIYLKALRYEKTLLVVNFISAMLTIIIAYVVVYIFKNFEISILLVIIMLLFRCSITDFYIRKVLAMDNSFDLASGIISTIVFICTNKFIVNKVLSAVIYISFLIAYLLVFFKKILPSYKWLLARMKSR